MGMRDMAGVLLLAVALVAGDQPVDGQGEAWLSPGSTVGEEIVGPDGGALVWVPGGKFMMGSTEEDLRYALGRLDGQRNEAETPVHPVRVSKGFWLGRCEVTNAQYRAYCEAIGAEFPQKSGEPDNHPVGAVSWGEAAAYCHHHGLMLPSEAQWEYAARGPENRWFPWGNQWDGTRCCYSRRKGPNGTTFPVGSFPAGRSWCGALDLAGNIQEWCQDWYDRLYYAASPEQDPEGPGSGEYRCARGGGYGNPPAEQRSAARNINYPEDQDLDFGFRVCFTP
jgi:formylglycine-generating enzyme required for sulfatase activity